MTLDEICQNAHELSQAQGWGETSVSTRMVHVASEVGEVADAVLALCEAGEEDINAARTALGHEIFDVIWNLCALANATGVDVEDAACEKVALNADREWRPARTATE